MMGAGHKLAKPRSDRIVVEFSALKSATSGRRWVLAADHGIFFRCQTAPLKYSYILGGMFSWCACATCLRTASEYWKRSPQMRQCHWSRAKMYGRHSGLFGSSLGLGIFKSCATPHARRRKAIRSVSATRAPFTRSNTTCSTARLAQPSKHGRRATRHVLFWAGWRVLEGPTNPRFRTIQLCPKDLPALLREAECGVDRPNSRRRSAKAVRLRSRSDRSRSVPGKCHERHRRV